MSQSFSGLQQSWYSKTNWRFVLLPLTLVFVLLSNIRRYYWRAIKKPTLGKVPVIVVGNIAVGGSGKTPLLIALADFLKNNNKKVGIISRGYGSNAKSYPYHVKSNSSVKESGDEPLLIAKALQCPVVIDANRTQAYQYLISHFDVDVVLSDDGLQHYALARHIEIAVIDGSRGVGNGYCLPSGPLRESPSRLNTVDFVIVNGNLKKPNGVPSNATTMTLKSLPWRRVVDDEIADISELSQVDKVHAITGIGNPERFFNTLTEMNLIIETHSFDDHHDYTLADIEFDDQMPIVMTAKDAVKCRELLTLASASKIDKNKYYYLPVTAELQADFCGKLLERINQFE